MFAASSKMTALCSGLCLVLLVVCLHSQSAEGVRACGKQLNSVLSLVCGNGFATRVRKSLYPLDPDVGVDGEGEAVSENEIWPFLAGIESTSLTKTRRRRLGVVHECCLKPCSMSEMMSYCRPSAH